MKHRLMIYHLIFFYISIPLHSQWYTNPTVNTPICIAANGQFNSTITSDGLGGAIITWQDNRASIGRSDIYAQRINASGFVQWTANGVPICTVVNDQSPPVIISDGLGGAIITWEDHRNGVENYDIYAQRIDGDGILKWKANGVPICIAAGNQSSPKIVSDGEGGAIITWDDSRDGASGIYAQRINASGVMQWRADGVPISTAANNPIFPTITSDCAGGAIIAWQDVRPGTISDVYAQRINTLGVLEWIAGGVLISAAARDQKFPTIISDGSGGAIITWNDYRNDNSDVYAQCVNAVGVVQWQTDGVPICTAEYIQSIPAIMSDSTGGAIITWHDYRDGGANIYAQRINAVGVVLWHSNGVMICNAAKGQYSPTIVNDGDGGAIITWNDYRNDTSDIYAQCIDATGTAQWDSNGVPICTASYEQVYPDIISDGAGGGIITWNDYRSGTNYDIFAQNISPDGTLGLKITFQYSVSGRWNMVSVPLLASDYRKTIFYPTAISPAWTYEQGIGYIQKDTLENGIGYWLKFGSDQIIEMTGFPHAVDTIDLTEGWNMIGSLASPVPVNSIESIPSGIIVGDFYGYVGSYYSADTLKPFMGYWVKVSEDGQLILNVPTK